ncbi:MAG: ABC transporter ATP-binding protein [Clostridia bacterium]|nr:ABC transporter ATP-binding protein [Clostridia bacterium]
MFKLLRYIKRYTKESIISPFFKLLEASFELFVPLVVAQIIDIGIATKDTAFIIQRCLILLALAVIGLSCTLLAQYYAAKAAVGFSCDVKHSLFSHIQSLSHTEIDKLGTSTMITRMTSDMNQVQSGVNLTLRLFMRSPFIVFGAMIMAFTIDVKAALTFAIVIPVLSLIVFGIMCATIPLHKKVQARLDRVLGLTRENLSGARVIRAFAVEDDEIRSFNNSTSELNLAQKFVGKISAIMNPATYAIVNIAISFLIWQGAIEVNVGNLSQGQVIALYNYMSQILIELIKLANLIVTITKAVACGNRIQAIFEIKPSIDSAENNNLTSNSDFAVEFNHASLKYATAKEESLTNIDFSVKKGETIGIIGGTGSGKTSLISLIPRFYDTNDGSVYVNGINVKDYPVQKLRDLIGIVPQKAVLFSGTIRDNMKWGNENASDEEIISAITIAQAKDVLDGKPAGLDCVIEQDGRNLSGGQRQRFTIARALVKKPPILILDDSASALDYATDARLRASLASLDYSPTVFIVSQRTASVMNANKIVVLDDGEIAGIGTHEELLKSCVVYQEIYNSQFKREGTQ